MSETRKHRGNILEAFCDALSLTETVIPIVLMSASSVPPPRKTRASLMRTLVTVQDNDTGHLGLRDTSRALAPLGHDIRGRVLVVMDRGQCLNSEPGQ